MREATVAAVDPSYFEYSMRRFLPAAGSPPRTPFLRVAIVDQGFVDQILQGRNAVGQQVRRLPGRLTALGAWELGRSRGKGRLGRTK